MEGKFTLYSSKTQKIYLIQKYSQSDAQTMGILESEAFKMELKEQQWFLYGIRVDWASQQVVVVKKWPANAGDTREAGLIPGLGRFPWRRKWQPAPVFLPGEDHGQRSLVGYSPQRVAASRTWLKWLSTHTRLWRDISIHHNYSRLFLLTGKIFPGICIGFRWQLCQFWVSFTWHRMGRKKSKQKTWMA